MNLFLLVFRRGAALLLGSAIGLGRPWGQHGGLHGGLHGTGLRTNALVAIGADMFVIMGGLASVDGSQGRVAAHVVSGGRVIRKDDFPIRGRNTAAMLGRTGAVDTLAAPRLAQGVNRVSSRSGTRRKYEDDAAEQA